MKLTETQELVLTAIGLRGDASISDLAKHTGIKPYKIRYVLDDLFRKKIISRRVVIDFFKLGYSVYGIWFSIPPQHRALHSKILEYLVAASKVGYVGEFGGEYQIKFDIYVKRPAEVGHFIQMLSQKFGEVFRKKTVASTLALHDFPLRHLNTPRKDFSSIRTGIGDEMIEIDDVDHSVLRAIASIGNQSHADIARKIGMRSSSLDYRIKKLRENKVILAYQCWTEVEGMYALGHPCFVHKIYLRRHDSESTKKILDFAHHDPAVYHTTLCVGEWDAEMSTCLKSPSLERQFLERIETNLGGILSAVITEPIFRHLKVDGYPFD